MRSITQVLSKLRKLYKNGFRIVKTGDGRLRFLDSKDPYPYSNWQYCPITAIYKMETGNKEFSFMADLVGIVRLEMTSSLTDRVIKGADATPKSDDASRILRNRMEIAFHQGVANTL